MPFGVSAWCVCHKFPLATYISCSCLSRMSFRYSVYRTYEESADCFQRCFKRQGRDGSAEVRELQRLLNDQFYIILMRTPYSDLVQEHLWRLQKI